MSLSPAEIQYMEEHIHDNKVPNVIVTIAICLSIAYIAVGLRLYARHITGVRLGGDDYWIIAALVRVSSLVNLLITFNQALTIL